MRPLYDDGASSATAATRDYMLKVDDTGGAPMLNVFGGKITTYRRLAEDALDKIVPFFPGTSGHWTAGVALPGGDFPVDGVETLIARLMGDYPFPQPVLGRAVWSAPMAPKAGTFWAMPGARPIWAQRFRRDPDRARSDLADDARIRPHRRRRGLAAHQAGAADERRRDRET